MKTILITGGTGGLGTAVTQRLAREYRCVVLYHGDAGFEALRKVVDVEGVSADVSDAADVTRALASIGELHAVVHLVGGFAAGDDADTWSKMIALNVTSAANVFRAAIPHLSRGGRIVAISSSATLDQPKGLSAYVVTKSALNALVEVFARELKDRSITVNALLPSSLGTPAMKSQADAKTLVPIERVAESIAWLLSDAAANVTGSLIPLRA
jgi:NAD(P)-dependent dehydrogenase (short-subunit alcohol dehydrogenase family)